MKMMQFMTLTQDPKLWNNDETHVDARRQRQLKIQMKMAKNEDDAECRWRQFKTSRRLKMKTNQDIQIEL